MPMPGATCEQESAPLSVEVLEKLLRKTEVTFHVLQRVRSSPVQLPKTELEMIKLFGFLRDFMMTLLQSERGDRVALRGIFGGDCTRISRIRAVLDAASLSDAARGDHRVAACLSACTSVETVLGDLGLGYALRGAQEAQRKTLAESLAPQSEAARASLPEAVDEHAVREELEYSECGSSCFADASGVLDFSGMEQRVPEAVSPETVCEPEPPIEEDSAMKTAVCSDAHNVSLEIACEPDTECGKENERDVRNIIPCGGNGEPSLDTIEKRFDEEPTKTMECSSTPCTSQRQIDSVCEPSPEPEIGESHAEDTEEQAAVSGCLLNIQDFEDKIQRRLPAPNLRRTSAPSIMSPRPINSFLETSRQRKLSPRCSSQTKSSASNARPRQRSCSGVQRVSEQTIAKDSEGEQPSFRARKSRNPFSMLSWAHQCLIRELFSHYVGPGGVSVGSGLGLSRFRRVLRDCFLLNETVSDVQTGDEMMMLTVSQADLMLAQAAGNMSPGVAQRLRTVEAFARALAAVAIHVCPELAAMPEQALDVFCNAVLQPLGERVLRGAGKDVQAAVATLADPDVANLLNRCQQGLSAIFASNASGVGAPDPYRRGHWTARDGPRFAVDVGFAAELSHASTQQIFGACASYEASCGRGEPEKLSFGCFLLALVVISHRLYAETRRSPQARLATLLRRVSVQMPGHHDIAAAARSVMRARS